MEIQVREDTEPVTIEIKGYIDTRTAKEAGRVFDEMSAKYDEVILDMAEVSYISSAGIRVLRNLYVSLYKKGGSLDMKNIGSSMQSVLEMTGLLDLLHLEKIE